MYSRNERFNADGRNQPNPNSGYKQSLSWKPMSPSAGADQKQAMNSMYSKNQLQSENARDNFGRQNGQASTSGLNNVVATPKFQPSNVQTAASGSNQNTLGLMGSPRPRAYSSSETSTATNLGHNSLKTSDGGLKFRNVGETEKEKLCILTGTVERVIKYGKIFQNRFSYFQVFGSVVSIKVGKVPFENTMLLRDKKGPILQLIYYSNTTHINIEDFHLGQNLRAVGRMVGQNVMSASTIRAATEEELEILPRLCYISDYSVSVLCGDGPMSHKS